MSEATMRRKAVAERALEEGVSPLDVMLITMRSLWKQAVGPDGDVVNIGKAMQANVVAKDAAPFLHPRLASIEATGKNGGPLLMVAQTMTAKEAAEAYASTLHGEG